MILILLFDEQYTCSLQWRLCGFDLVFYLVFLCSDIILQFYKEETE